MLILLYFSYFPLLLLNCPPVGCRPHVGNHWLRSSTTWPLPVAVELVKASVADVDSTAMGGWLGCWIKRSPQSRTSLAQPPFSILFDQTVLHHSPSVSTIPLTPSKSRKLILLMLGQCTNPGPPYYCPVCLHPACKQVTTCIQYISS